MRSLHPHPGLILIAVLAMTGVNACGKDKTPAAPVPAAAEAEAAPAAAAPAEAAKAAPAAPAPSKADPAGPAAPAAAMDTKTAVAQPAASDTEGGADDETKAKLGKVYMEIYCAQRRGESEKLLDIYTTNGFDDPETWTKVWTKAAQDGAWVAKITHDAIRTCGDEAPAAP